MQDIVLIAKIQRSWQNILLVVACRKRAFIMIGDVKENWKPRPNTGVLNSILLWK